jgi:hypothetical protein
LPKKPTDVELKVIKEMFEASVDGQPYDTERWGQYFRPAGVNAPAGSATHVVDGHGDAHEASTKSAPAVKPAVTDEDPPFDVDEAPAASAPVQAGGKASGNAADILAMIRARQSKQ